jgi:hypothetical protein
MASNEPLPATPGRLAFRLGVCQLLGMIAGLETARLVGAAYGHSGPSLTGSYVQDLLIIAVVALLAFGVPFFGLALIVLLIFIRSVLRRPFLWSVALPAALLALALWAFPIAELEGILWIVLIPLSATLAGMFFYIWARIAPLIPPTPAGPPASNAR